MRNRPIDIVEVSLLSGIATGRGIDGDPAARLRGAGPFPPRTGAITKDHR